MESAGKKIVSGINEFILLALLSALPPLAVYLDIVMIGHGVPEASVTEFIQETLILASAMAFWACAWRNPGARGFLVLVAGFFSCMLIRELEGLLDAIWKGFWVWPAFLVAAGSVSYVLFCCRDRVVQAMSDFIETKPYFYLFFGLLVILVFSRVFGSGTLLWEHLVADYTHAYKSALQEGLELFGYLFVAYGSWLFYQSSRVVVRVRGGGAQPQTRPVNEPSGPEGQLARR